MGVRLAYALLMIIFDRINNKGEKSTCELPEETCVRDERSKLTEYDQSGTRLCETSKEVFGIGLVSSDADKVTETTELTAKTYDDDSHGKFSLNYSSAINILDRAQMSLASFQSLVNLSESGTEISHRHFPYLNTSITLFYNSHFSMNRDTDEHDKRIDNILKSWSMSREHIAKDGDCCFRAVARNVSKLTETGGLSSQAYEHMANLGLVNLDEESLSDSLRVLTVSEWSGENRPHYESFLTTDNFDEEVKRFTHKGYFTGELGNLMVLAMANVLKMPIVIFSSLENYPTIPILPRGQLNDMPTLFVSFNAAGCGHYDYVHMETVRMVLEKQQEEQATEKKRPQVSCSCGASRKGQEKVSNVCNNVIGSYSSRCKCLKARVSCDGNCKCKGCSNPFGQSQAGNAEGECAPRKRRKFDIQNSIKLKSKAYLNEKGEPLREGALTKEEFFVVEELFKLFHENREEMSSTSLLAYYNFIHSTNCTLDPRPLLLRPMSHEQIKKAIAAHDHDASVMTALFKKQVELCFAES